MSMREKILNGIRSALGIVSPSLEFLGKPRPEPARALKIAFLGYNTILTARYLEQLAADNAEQVRRYDRRRGRVTLKDGTEIIAIMPGFF